MATLTYRERKRLPPSEFVFPSSKKYPIPDIAHAGNARARVMAHGTPAEKRKVYSETAKRFPSLKAQAMEASRNRS